MAFAVDAAVQTVAQTSAAAVEDVDTAAAAVFGSQVLRTATHIDVGTDPGNRG